MVKLGKYRISRDNSERANALRNLILYWVGVWVGREVDLDETADLVGAKKKVDESGPQPQQGHDVGYWIEPVISAANAPTDQELRDRIENLLKLEKAIKALNEALDGLTENDIYELEYDAPDYRGGNPFFFAYEENAGKAPTRHITLEGEFQKQIIELIGFSDAIRLSCRLGQHRASDVIHAAYQKLPDKLPKRKRGKQRNQKAYDVALKLAWLYMTTTGKKPSYAHGGQHGSFSPALKAVYETIPGLENADLQHPVKAAQKEYDKYLLEKNIQQLWAVE